jgi:hypothetical protein
MLYFGTERGDMQENINSNVLLEDFGVAINSDCLVCMT